MPPLKTGRNLPLTGNSQLKKLDSFIKRRNEIARIYNEEFSKIDWIETPKTKENIKHAWHLYTILLKGVDRNEFFRYLRQNKIGVNVHYIPSYRFSYYKENFHIKNEDYPVTEEVFQNIISLPMYSKMSDEQVRRVIQIVKDYKQI